MKKAFFLLLLIGVISSQAIAFLVPFRQITPMVRTFISEYSEDGSRIYVMFDDKAVIIKADGTELLSHTSTLFHDNDDDIGFEGCGNLIALPGDERVSKLGSVSIHDRNTLQKISTLEAPGDLERSYLEYVKFKDDCSQIFVQTDEKLKSEPEISIPTIRVFNPLDGKILFERTFAEDAFSSDVLVSHDFKYFAAAEWGEVAVFDFSSANPVYVYKNGDIEDDAFGFYPDSDHLVTFEDEIVTHHRISLKSVEYTATPPETLNTYEGVNALFGQPSKALIQSESATLYVYNVLNREFKPIETKLNTSPEMLCVDAKGKYLVAIDDGNLSLINIASGSVESHFAIEQSLVERSCGVSTTGSKVLFSTTIAGTREYKLR